MITMATRSLSVSRLSLADRGFPAWPRLSVVARPRSSRISVSALHSGGAVGDSYLPDVVNAARVDQLSIAWLLAYGSRAGLSSYPPGRA